MLFVALAAVWFLSFRLHASFGFQVGFVFAAALWRTSRVLSAGIDHPSVDGPVHRIFVFTASVAVALLAATGAVFALIALNSFANWDTIPLMNPVDRSVRVGIPLALCLITFVTIMRALTPAVRKHKGDRGSMPRLRERR